MREPLIVCENLVKIYRLEQVEVMALQGLDLTVERGEVMALVGRSGSGKSTLMNILGGLDRPTAGRVSVGGMDLLKLSERRLNRYRREGVGFVWQQSARNLIPYLTALQNVELPMMMAGRSPSERRRWSAELLETVGLEHRLGHRLAEMSGGEQQRVAIAVALANRPDVLLADEPTGELDSATSAQVYDVFHRLSETYGTTAVIVSHDADVARHVDRVVGIRDGKTSTEILRYPTKEEGAEDRHELVEYTVLDPAGRLQMPEEVLERYGMGRRVLLESRAEGVLLRAVPGEQPLVHRLVEGEDAPPPRRGGWRDRLRLPGRKGRGPR